MRTPLRLALVALGLAAPAAFAQTASDSCAGAPLIGAGTYTGTTVGATNDGVAGCGGSDATADVWYKVTPATDRILTVDSCGSPYDTVLSIHSGCGAGTVIVCNDDTCGLQSSVSTPVLGGHTYYIRVSGFSGSTGAYTLNVTLPDPPPPGPDSCGAAALIGPGTYTGSTNGTTNDGIPSGCGAADGSPDIWYKITPTQNRRLVVDSCGSNYDTVLAIHSGCAGGSVLACNDDSCGLQSSVEVSALANTTYYIRVSGYAGATGDYILNVNLVTPPPPGPDACADALLITPGTYSATTVGATPDGTSTCGNSDTSPDTWYKIVAPPGDMTLAANTCTDGHYDTVLSILTGCGGTTLACNDNSCGNQSRVTAQTVPGQTYYIRVAGANGAGGDYTLTVGFQAQPTLGPDVTVDALIDIAYYGNESGINAYAVGTESCNLGDLPVSWYSGTPFHPVIAQNMYRLKAGRFEQIGQSWLKNGFASTNSPGCTSSCTQPPDGGAQLGVGCADAYGSGLNGSQGNLRPRSDVNAATGEFPNASTNPPFSGVIARRLQVHQTDVDPALNTGALFFVDCQYVTQDDAQWNNGFNNNSYRRIGIPTTTANPSFIGNTVWLKPAIQAWRDNDPAVTLTNFDYVEPYTINSQNINITARFIVGTKVTDNGNGTWTYEYAIQNVNSHRSGGFFFIPVPAGTNVTNIAFHDVDYHSGEPYANTDWTMARTAEGVLWTSPETFAQNPNSNALRWSTLYNFRFTANFAPTSDLASIGLFRPGTPSAVNAVVPTPGGVPTCDADLNQDGNADQDDVAYLINVIGGGSNPTGIDPDFNHDGNADQDDVAALVNVIGGGNCP